MSGLEVAGLVLGTLPLVIKGLEAYINLLREWRKAPGELKSIHRQLSTDQVAFQNACEHLISDAVPQRDIEEMLQDPFGPLWHRKETELRIRRRLGSSYRPFESTIAEVQDALESVKNKLSIHVSDQGTVHWVEKSQITRTFRKWLYRMERKEYQEDLETISRGVTSLYTLSVQCVKLEPGRRKRSRCKVFTVLRDLSTSIHRGLCSSLACTHSHDVSFDMTMGVPDLEHDCDDDEIAQAARFKLAISSEVVGVSETKKVWDEVDIKTLCVPAPKPDATQNVAIKAKHTKRVAFSSVLGSSPVNQLQPPTEAMRDLKISLASVTKVVTDLALIKTPPETTEPEECTVNLCMALNTPYEEKPASYGYLIDKESSHRQFPVQPSGVGSDSDDWSIVTLEDVLKGRKGARPLLFLRDKLSLAFVVASSVLQLSKTPWLPGTLTRDTVHFFDRDKTSPYHRPFLSKTFPESPTRYVNDAPDGTKRRLSPNNPTLFALGMLLLEIILGQSLTQLRDTAFDLDDHAFIQDYMQARSMLEQRVPLISPAYRDIVVRCMESFDPRGLDDRDFQEEFYNGVVLKLEGILADVKLGSA